MNKFTRSPLHRTHEEEPHLSSSANARIFGQQVAVGEPLRLHGDAEFREEVEGSLEMIAKKRLLEVEAQATALLERANKQARELLEKANAQARAQADEMLAQAQSEVDGIREAAHEEGFKAGFQEGYAEASAQVEQETVDLLKSAQLLVDAAYLAEHRVLKDFEAHALTLIEHVIHKILGQTLENAPEETLALIQRGVESLYLSGKVKVVVSAHVLHEIRQYSATSQDALAAMSRFEFVADPALDAHQIFIIGQESSFDLTPEHQAQQLLSPLKKNLQFPRTEAAEPETSETSVEAAEDTSESEMDDDTDSHDDDANDNKDLALSLDEIALLASENDAEPASGDEDGEGTLA